MASTTTEGLPDSLQRRGWDSAAVGSGLAAMIGLPAIGTRLVRCK